MLTPPARLLLLTIEREVHPKDRAYLLTVSQVLGELKFSFPLLDEIFGVSQILFE